MAIALLTVLLQVLDQHEIVRGRSSSSDHAFSQGDEQESWWMNHRLEELMVQPHPTLQSSCALLSQNNFFLSRKMKRGCLNDWPPHVDRGWSSELESLQNGPSATAIGSSVLLLPDRGLWERPGIRQAEVVFSCLPEWKQDSWLFSWLKSELLTSPLFGLSTPS